MKQDFDIHVKNTKSNSKLTPLISPDYVCLLTTQLEREKSYMAINLTA